MANQDTAGSPTDSKKKNRLGRGLGALLGEYLPQDGAAGGYRTVPLARITANPFQPRREFDPEALAELEASIRENGLLQPLVVRPAKEDAPAGSDWELVAGERRMRAVQRLGWAEVPVIVREMDDRTLLVLAIVENVQRAGLSPLEEAEGYRQLIEEFGYTQKEVAESVGRERSTIANLLRLLHLPASVQRLVSAGSLTMGHARAILGMGDERRMAELARRTAAEGLSVRAVEGLVRNGKGETGKARRPSPAVEDPHVRHIEAELQRELGTAVRVQVGREAKGKIEISFFSADDFERVTELLLGAESNRI